MKFYSEVPEILLLFKFLYDQIIVSNFMKHWKV